MQAFGAGPSRTPPEDIPLRPVSRSRIRGSPFARASGDGPRSGGQHDAKMDSSGTAQGKAPKRRKSRLSDAVDPDGSEVEGEQEWLIGDSEGAGQNGHGPGQFATAIATSVGAA